MIDRVIFSKKATQRLIEQAHYIFEKTKDPNTADAFLDNMKLYLEEVLTTFPKIGRATPEFGEGVRKVIYQSYSILYRINQDTIEVLTIYRENIPEV